MLASRISLINEVAALSEDGGADVLEIENILGRDLRIGKNYLHAGCGFGGTSFAKDLQKLKSSFVEFKRQGPIIDQIIESNELQKDRVFRKIWRHFHGSLADKKIALFGLGYKPFSANTDNAPSEVIAKSLLGQKARVFGFDPIVRQARGIFIGDLKEVCSGADALVFLTEYEQFKFLDFSKIRSLVKNPIVFDGRNFLDSKLLKSLGFFYSAIGRG